MDCRCGTKRKAEEGTDQMCNCATKRKVEEKAPSLNSAESPPVTERQMTRLSQEEINHILSRTKHAPFPNPDDREPHPSMSPEYLEEARELYRSMTENHESGWASFSQFQGWVHSEFAAKGFVEVDDDFLRNRARVRAEFAEEWAEMLEEQDVSDLVIGEDDEYVGDDGY